MRQRFVVYLKVIPGCGRNAWDEQDRERGKPAEGCIIRLTTSAAATGAGSFWDLLSSLIKCSSDLPIQGRRKRSIYSSASISHWSRMASQELIPSHSGGFIYGPQAAIKWYQANGEERHYQIRPASIWLELGWEGENNKKRKLVFTTHSKPE